MYIEKLYRVYVTIREMLHDRGYDKLEYGRCADSFEQFKQYFVTFNNVEKHLMSYVYKNSITDVLILVCFMSEDTIKSEHVKKIERMMSNRVNNCIMIYPHDITSQTRKYIESLPDTVIEKFAENDLIINITKHVLMPKFHIMSLSERRQFLKETKFQKQSLPKMTLDDPISKYFGVKRGEIIKVVRKSETAGEYISYRICV